jgi:hypothetical protein
MMHLVQPSISVIPTDSQSLMDLVQVVYKEQQPLRVLVLVPFQLTTTKTYSVRRNKKLPQQEPYC